MIFGDGSIIKGLTKVFESDWKAAKEVGDRVDDEDVLSEKLARKVAKAISKEIPTVSEVIESISGESVLNKSKLKGVDIDALEETVRTAVKSVVADTIQEVAGSPAA